MDIGLLLTIFGTVLAVVAFPATYYMGRRNRQKPDLCFVTDFDVLMSPEDGLAAGTLDLTVGGQEIKRISRTYIAIFNSKGDSVSGADVVSTDPLRITVPDGDSVLQARIIAQSRPQCGLSLKRQGVGSNTVEINFDFLDANDGAILEILHQGDSAAALAGTIRGASFRKRGTGDLTPLAIRTIAAKSLVSRFNYYTKKKGQNRFTVTALLITPLALLGMTIYTVASTFLNQPTGPISTDGINFTTLDGQKQFLAAAAAAGLKSRTTDESLPFMLIQVGLVFAMTYYLYHMLMTNRIPTAITSHIVDDVPVDD